MPRLSASQTRWICPLALGLLLALAGSAPATLVIENVTFHRTSNIGYDGSSPNDQGGGLFVQVRNTGSGVEELTSENLLINGTSVTSIMAQGPNAPTPGWVRVWPESVAPGEAATWVVKTFGGTVTEGATLASVEVSSDGGSTASVSNVPLVTPTLRIAHVVPSPDHRQVWVFLRNDDSVPMTVDELVLNDHVTSSTEFLGGNGILPGWLLIARVDFEEPVAPLTPLTIRASALRDSDSTRVTVGSFLRLTEPEYGLTTWGSSPSNDEQRVQRNRELYGLTGNSWGGVSPILATKANRYFYRQRMLDILDMSDTNTVDMTNAPVVAALAGTGQVGAWFVEDEPDLSYSSPTRNPRAMLNLSRAYWRLDPGTPTHLNLVSSNSAQAYALAVDHPALDAYMQYAPRHYGSFISQTYPIREALDQTENLKRVSEPIRFWMTPQGVSPGTWGTQPTPWGIAIQFWAQVMGGAKGLDGFQFDDTLDSSSDPGGVRALRMIDLIRELRLVEGLLLYGDPVRTVTTNKPASDLAARMIIGAEGIVVPVVNLQASHTRTLGSWGTPTKTDQVNVGLSFHVPHWIPVERVVEVTANGFQPVTHTVTDNLVQINGLTVVDSRIFLVGANDTTAPEAPVGLQSVPDLTNPGGTLLSWRQPFDNIGLMGYKVYQDGIEVADVRTPIAAVNPPAGCPVVYTVRAYDGSGNLGPDSNALVLDDSSPLDFRFEEPGNLEGWVPLNDIRDTVVEEGLLSFEVFDGPLSPPGQVDAYLAHPGLNVPTGEYDTLLVRLRNQTPNTLLELFWENEFGGWAGTGTGGGIRYQPVTISGNDPFLRDYVIDLSANPAWEGTVTNLRLDPANGFATGTVRIDRIAFLNSATHSPAWLFKRDGDAEGWGDPALNNQINTIDVVGGELRAGVSGGGDPFLVSPPFRASAAANRYVLIRMQNTTSATTGELFWSSTTAPGFDGTRLLSFAVTPGAGAMQEIILDMQGLPGWSGKIDRLRLDPTSGGPAGLVRIESIRLAPTLSPNADPVVTTPVAPLEVGAGEALALPAPTLCDQDREGTDVELTIMANHGVIQVPLLGAARIAGGANGTGILVLRGTPRAITEALLAGITYASDADYSGTDEVTFLLNDMGNGRPGGPLTDEASVSITVIGAPARFEGWALIGG